MVVKVKMFTLVFCHALLHFGLHEGGQKNVIMWIIMF